jgi:hypothetical protein
MLATGPAPDAFSAVYRTDDEHVTLVVVPHADDFERVAVRGIRSPGFQSGALRRTSVSYVPDSASSLNTGTPSLLPGAGRRLSQPRSA